MPAVAGNHQIRTDLHRASRGSRLYSNDSITVANQANALVPHPKLETIEALSAPGQEVQKIPLRHQRDKFAMGGQQPKIGDVKVEIADARADRCYLLVRKLEQAVEQTQFVHYVEGRRVDSVTTKIPEEVIVLFENRYLDACARQ